MKFWLCDNNIKENEYCWLWLIWANLSLTIIDRKSLDVEPFKNTLKLWVYSCSKDEVVAATENLQEHTAGDHVEQVKQHEPHWVMTDKPGLFGIIWAIISEHSVGELPWNSISQVNESTLNNPSSYPFYNNYRAFPPSLDKVSPSTEIILLGSVVTPAMCLFRRHKNINFYLLYVIV